MWQYKHTDELYHYGVLGMKWGQRKKRVPSEDHVKSRELRKKKTSEMSTAELKKLNDRLTAENNYKENLRKERNFKVTPSKVVTGVLAVAGTVTLAATRYNEIKKIVDPIVKKVHNEIGSVKMGKLRP